MDNNVVEYDNTDENVNENMTENIDENLCNIDKQGSRRMITDAGLIIETPSESPATSDVRKKKIGKLIKLHNA